MSKLLSKKNQDFFCLFMVPGMHHCSTAQDLALILLPFKSIGLDDFDALTALENWVEKGIAPDEIMASGQNLEGDPITRPLFPYPLYPKFTGGDPADPGSFMAENDGTVRWGRFRKDTFFAFEVPELENNPIAEGEGLQHFYPYDFDLEEGTYKREVWSPSMFEAGARPGFRGSFEVE